MQEDIVLKRNLYNQFQKEINVEHEWVYHSPDGFEWGYGGSGPADLALNILLKFGLDQEEAFRLHQDFKWRFISEMPREGGTIKKEDILEFIEENQNGS